MVVQILANLQQIQGIQSTGLNVQRSETRQPKNTEGVIEIRVPQWSIYHLMFDGCIMSYFLLENGFQT